MIALDFRPKISYNVRAFSDARFSIEGRDFRWTGISALSSNSTQPRFSPPRQRCGKRETPPGLHSRTGF